MTTLREAAQRALEALELTSEKRDPMRIAAISALRAALAGPVITDDMKSAVRFAPSSAYWSDRLREFFGPEARNGIDVLERRLSKALAAAEPVIDKSMAKRIATQLGWVPPPQEPEHKPHCALLQIPSRECDCGVEPAPEPVAWLQPKTVDSCLRADLGYETCSPDDYGAFPVYRSPPQRKPLTEEEIDRITDAQWASNNHKPIYAAHRAYARAIEQAHGIIESAIKGDKA